VTKRTHTHTHTQRTHLAWDPSIHACILRHELAPEVIVCTGGSGRVHLRCRKHWKGAKALWLGLSIKSSWPRQTSTLCRWLANPQLTLHEQHAAQMPHGVWLAGRCPGGSQNHSSGGSKDHRLGPPHTARAAACWADVPVHRLQLRPTLSGRLKDWASSFQELSHGGLEDWQGCRVGASQTKPHPPTGGCYRLSSCQGCFCVKRLTPSLLGQRPLGTFVLGIDSWACHWLFCRPAIGYWTGLPKPNGHLKTVGIWKEEASQTK